MPLASCRLSTEGRGGWSRREAARRHRLARSPGPCAAPGPRVHAPLGARRLHGARVADARSSRRGSRGRRTLPARPLHAARRTLLARSTRAARDVGTRSARCVAACAAGTDDSRTRCTTCTPDAGGLQSPEAILGAAASPARAGTTGKPGKAQGVPASHPTQPHRGLVSHRGQARGPPRGTLRNLGPTVTPYHVQSPAMHHTRGGPGLPVHKAGGSNPGGLRGLVPSLPPRGQGTPAPSGVGSCPGATLQGRQGGRQGRAVPICFVLRSG